MAHPMCWPSQPIFYPMGVNAATSLSQDLSPEQSADILLLGCGDPRNILYTISTDITCPPAPRKLNITCCDLEPAVLARNLLLYTLIEDDTPSNHLWDIFYHPKLSDHTFGLIASQSRKLLELSQSPETWRQSKYDSFLKFVDASSLVELRRLWTSYAEFPDLPSDRLEKLQKEYKSMSEYKSHRAKTTIDMGMSRSAAGMWREAMKPVTEQFGHYWEHGTIATTNKEIKKTTRLNPTFCYSVLGETFAVYEDTFPQGYHFASAFTPLEFDPVGPTTNSAMAKAKQQFKAGCTAFQASRSASSIILRFFVGDALALCRALDLFNRTQDPHTGEFASPWRATPIDISEQSTSSPAVPSSFDVIDFSTLAPQLGLVNVLLVSQPLLKKHPTSQAVLYTDMPMQVGHSIRTFPDRLCGSVPSLSILVGLAPRPYISLFTSISNTHELAFGERSIMYMERVPWVDPNGGDNHTYTESSPVVTFEWSEIAELLFSVYRKMFQFDTMAPSTIQKLSHEQRRIFSAPHYTRESVVFLFAHVKRRIHIVNADWERTATRFMDLVAMHDTRISLTPHFHDLQNTFRLHGLAFTSSEQNFGDDVLGTEIFQGWAEAQTIACVVLNVPWCALEAIRQDKTDPSPRLVCNFSTSSSTVLTVSSIQAVWGRCIPLKGSQDRYVIEEDFAGFHGKSDLVVSFWANAETMLSLGTTISLSLRETPLVLSEYAESLGPGLSLYTTQITDKDHVLVLPERPMGLSRSHKPYQYTSQSVNTDGPVFTVKTLESVTSLETDVEVIEARLKLEPEADRVELSKANNITSTQVGPCTLQLSFGSTTRVLRFPYPIRGPDCNFRMDRSSHYITVTAPFYEPVTIGGYPSDIAPVIHHNHPTTWNIHHINISRMPKVDIQQREKIRAWLLEHTTVQLTDRERVIQRSTHATQRRPSEVLVNVKESIAALIQHYVGIREGPQATFSLIEPLQGSYAIIFVVGLRLDLAGATCALECAVVPLSTDSARQLHPGVLKLEALAQIMQVRTRPAEVIAWKHLLPAFVERCRTWSHKSDCQYRLKGRVPLSEDIEVDPLCQCGQGIGFDGLEWRVPAWEGLLPYATKAAVSPLFGVSYLETVLGPASAMQDTRKPISYSEPHDVCWRCGGIGRPLLTCQRCKKARYCSEECQRIHWKEEHKHVCVAPG
ncbi:hypothetical protein BDV93DRAFT_97478 [Ceratobasidium sp. AG-I]|nr:hypothetical protein BDV93DRAFT_97478 [Ceratobasidium sp. AG-I]